MNSKSTTKYILTAILTVFFCLATVGCGKTDNDEVSIPEQTTLDEEMLDKDDSDELSEAEEQEVDPLLIQASLFIQDGFRTYEIEGTYQLYFAEPTENDVKYALVCGDNMCWGHFAYSYDKDNDWYTFRSQYEPIFSQVNVEEWWQENRKYEISDIEEIIESSVYETEISRYSYIYAAGRYDGQNGPIESDEPPRDRWMHGGYSSYSKENVSSYSFREYLYTYYDERMEIDISIEYPVVYISGSYNDDEIREFQDKINGLLRKACFYGYWSDYYDDGDLHPYSEMYTYIERQFLITRMDDDYLSMRIYESNYTRGANHPNEWERGITIDMHTGEALTLEDVVGEDWTMSGLFESGAFRCLWGWENDDGEGWIHDLIEKTDEETALSSYDLRFYITDTSLGLVTFVSRYYTCIEAEFTDLGITGF